MKILVKGKNKKIEYRFIVSFILFLIALIIGLFTCHSYGISWDEFSSQTIGQVNYAYLFYGDNTLNTFGSRDYGVAFELPLFALERILRLNDFADIYLMRHIVTHIFFLLSAVALFLLIEYLYHNKLLATIGFLFLLLNPVIYGHSFFNSKDLPLMSMHIFCFLLAAIAFNKKTIFWYALLGIFCGLLTNIRIVGSLLSFTILFFFLIDIISSWKNKDELKKNIIFCFVFLLFMTAALYLSWPYLYKHPILNFISGFNNMARYRWFGNVLFWGKEVNATHLDWYYGITWFLISNPILYLVAGFGGILYFIFKFTTSPATFFINNANRNILIYVIGFIVPLVLVIVLHSVLYDSWRHLFFIYPSFILLAIFGLNKIIKTRARTMVITILFACFVYVGYYFIENFPYQHVYFNELVSDNKPEKLRKTFDMDYWGTSYQQATEYILKTDTSNLITIVYKPNPPLAPLLIFNAKDRKRIRTISTIEDADYLVTNYRNHPQDFPIPHSKECYSIKVLNSTILSIFKLK